MAAKGFPVARIEEYAKPCEPAIHVLRSVFIARAQPWSPIQLLPVLDLINDIYRESSGFLCQ